MPADPSFWRNLEAQFRALPDSSRLTAMLSDGQWIVHGGPDNRIAKAALQAKFQAYARQAAIAAKLPHSVDGWLNLLCAESSHFRRQDGVLLENGIQVPSVGGRIDNVAVASADFCVEMATRAAEREATASESGTLAAMKHIRSVFDESTWKCSQITEKLCFADLHPDVNVDVEAYRAFFPAYRTIIGQSAAAAFDKVSRLGTPSALFHAYIEAYGAGLKACVSAQFAQVLQIALADEAGIDRNPTDWAEAELRQMMAETHNQAIAWIKAACDPQPSAGPGPLSDDEADEVFTWRNWRAPRLIHMNPSGNTPYSSDEVWAREDEATTLRLLDGLSKRFSWSIDFHLRSIVGKAAVERAQRSARPDAEAPTGRGVTPKTEHDNPNNPDNWSPLRRRVEEFRKVKALVAGPHERIPESLVREVIAEQNGIKPEDVSLRQIQFEVSGLLQDYPAITLIPSPAPTASSAGGALPPDQAHVEARAAADSDAENRAQPRSARFSYSQRDGEIFALVGVEGFRTLTNAEISKRHRVDLRKRFRGDRQAEAVRACLNRIRRANRLPLSSEIRPKKKRSRVKTRTGH